MTTPDVTVLCIGQSNMVAYDTPPVFSSGGIGTYNWKGGAWVTPCTDPCATASPNRASLKPKFCERYRTLSRRTVGVINGARLGRGIEDPAGDHWSDNTDFCYTNAIGLVAAAGNVINFVLVWVGEADIIAGITKANFKTGFMTMVNNFRTDLANANLEFFMVKPYCAGPTLNEIRAACDELEDENDGVYVVDDAINYSTYDGTHVEWHNFNTIGYNIANYIGNLRGFNMSAIFFGEGLSFELGLGHKMNGLNSGNTDKSTGDAVSILIRAAGMSVSRLGIIRFDISSLSSDAIVSSAYLFIKTSALTAGGNVSVHRLITQWGQTDYDAGITEDPAIGGQATFDCAFDYNGVGDVPWAGGGFSAADYEAVADDTQAFAAAGNWNRYDVTNTVRNIVKRSAINHGWAIISAIAANNSLHTFDAIDETDRPYLVVNYTSISKKSEKHFNMSISMGIRI